MIDCVSKDELKNLDDEIWSHLLFDKEKLEFLLKTYDPDHRSPIGEIDETPSPVYYAVKLELVGIPERLVAQIRLPPVQNDDSPDDRSLDIHLTDPETRGLLSSWQLIGVNLQFWTL